MLLRVRRTPVLVTPGAENAGATAAAREADEESGSENGSSPDTLPAITRGVIERHAARAAIGALTALAPACDLEVRGPVAAAMSLELARLSGADVRSEVLRRLLAEAQRQIEAAAPLFLAVAARALGQRAVARAGGAVLLRAVALGLSFEALGRAVAEDLERWGVLRPAGAPMRLRSTSAADLAPLAPRYARLTRLALQRGAQSPGRHPK
jgi:hypothetical protein